MQATPRIPARWITLDPDMVSHILEEVLFQEAWITAARAQQFALTRVIWEDERSSESMCALPDHSDPPATRFAAEVE